MRLIDTHCHLPHGRLRQQLADVLDRARAAGLCHLICATSAVEEAYDARNIAHDNADVTFTVGTHPHYAKDFTPELLAECERRGVGRTAVTLHVGLGTFKPVKVEAVEDHRMESERYEVSEESARRIAAVDRARHRVVAVGSTTVRTLESVAAEHGAVVGCGGRTELFIRPPYAFHVVDAMLTNFHLPRSTLIMMVCALAGHELVMRAYAEAVREKYRFYSYGDCMLIV